MKNTELESESGAEATPDPEGDAGASGPAASSDNEQLANYLTSLLASAPAKLDFSIFPDPVDSFPLADAAEDDVICFGAERAKQEIKYLGNENNLLKMKVARLIAQLNDAECKLDALTSENGGLKADIESLQNKIQLYKIAINDASRRVQEVPAHLAEQSGGGKPDPGTEPPAVRAVAGRDVSPGEVATPVTAVADPADPAGDDRSQGAAAVTVSRGKGDRELLARRMAQFREPEPRVPARPILPVFATAGEKVHLEQTALPAEEPGRGMMRPHLVDDDHTPKPGPAMVVFSGKAVVSDAYVPDIRPASKVIKKEAAQGLQPRPEGAQDEKAAAPPANAAGRANQEPTPAPTVTPSRAKDRNGEPGKGMPRPIVFEDLKVKAAPETKTVAKKHIEHYRLLQEEADATEILVGPDIDGKA